MDSDVNKEGDELKPWEFEESFTYESMAIRCITDYYFEDSILRNHKEGLET